MPFPTTPVLFTFTGTNGDDLPVYNAAWSTMASMGGLEIQGNAATGIGTDSINYVNTANYGPKAEAFVTIATADTTNGAAVLLCVRGQQETDVLTFDTYLLRYTVNSSGPDSIELMIGTNGVPTAIGAAISQEISNGDSLGISVENATLTAWYKAAGGQWTVLGTRTDSGNTLPAAGKLALYCSGTTFRLTNFGGGTTGIHATLIGTRGATSTNTASTGGGVSIGGAGAIGYIVICTGTSVSITSVADNKGNTFAQIGAVQTGNGKIYRYKCENWVGGTGHTATVNLSAADAPTIHLVEITGAMTSSPEDATASRQLATSMASPYTITSGTLAQAASICLAGIEVNSGSNGDYASSNFTVLSQEPDVATYWTSAVAALVVNATTAVTPSWTVAGRTGTQATGRFIDIFREWAPSAPFSPEGERAKRRRKAAGRKFELKGWFSTKFTVEGWFWRQWIAAVASGTYNLSASDAITATDSATTSATESASATEAAAASDASTAAMTVAASASDAAAPGDSASMTPSLSQAGTDAIAATDSATDTMTVSVAATDAAAAGDSATDAMTVAAAAGTESVTAADTASQAIAFPVAATDPVTGTDSASQTPTLNQSASDAAAASDSATDTMTVSVSASDPAGAGDTATETMTVPVSASDAATPGDASTQVTALPAAATDAAAATDTASTAATMPVAASDSVAAADASTETPTMSQAATDPAAAGDSASATATAALSASDAATAQDSATEAIGFNAAATDAAAGTDSASQAAVFPRTATDAIAASDTSTITSVLTALAADAVNLADAAQVLAAVFNVSATDLIAALDSASAVFGAPMVWSTERTWTIRAENRTWIIESEDRTYRVKAENRTVTIEAEDRTLKIRPQDRTLELP